MPRQPLTTACFLLGSPSSLSLAQSSFTSCSSGLCCYWTAVKHLLLSALRTRGGCVYTVALILLVSAPGAFRTKGLSRPCAASSPSHRSLRSCQLPIKMSNKIKRPFPITGIKEKKKIRQSGRRKSPTKKGDF